MIVGLVAGLLQAIGATAPPSDDEFRAALLEKAPTAEIVSIDIQSSPGGGLACGTAVIGGAVEPFAVAFQRRDEGSTVWLVLPDGQRVRSPRDAGTWRIILQAPYRASSEALEMSAHSKLQWDAVNRLGALGLCPALTPPEGTVWTTEVGPDPSLTPEQRERARRLARMTTDLIFGPRPRSTEPDR